MRLDVKLDSPLNSGVARERSRKPWNPKRGYHPSPQSQRHRFADTEGMLAGVRYRAIDHNIAQGYRQLGPAPGDPDWEDIEQRFESKLLRRGLSSTLNELDSEKRSVLAAHPSSPSLTSAISNTPAGQGVGEAYKAIIPTVAFILTQQHFGQKVSPLKGDEPLVRGQVAHLMGLDHGDAKVTIPSTRPTRSLVHKKGATLDFLSYYSQKSAGRPMLRRQHEHADAQVFREKPYMVRSLSVELDEFERQPAILKNAMVGIKQAASGQLEGTDAAKSALAELPILFYSDRGTLWLRKHDYASFLRLAFKSLDTKKTEQHSFHFIVDVEEPKKPIRAYELNDDNGLVVYHANIKTNFNGDNCRFRIRAKNSEEAQPFVPNDEQKLVTFVNRQIGSYYWRPLPTFWQNGAEDSRPEKEDNTGTTYGERSKNFVKQVLHFFFGRPSTDMKMIIPGKPTFTIATSDSRSALSKEVQNILKDLLNPSRRMKTVRVGLYESSQSPTEAVHLHEPKPPAQAKGEEPRKAGSIQREPEKHFASESQPSSKTVQEDFDQTIQRFIQQRQAADSEAMRRLVNGQQPRVSPVDEGDNRVQQPPTSDDVYIEGLASRQRIVWRRPYNVASFLSMVVPLLQLDKKPRFTVRVYAGQQCYDQGIFDLVQHSTDPHAVMISDAAYETLKGDTIYVAPHLDSIDVYDLNKGKDEQPTGWVNAPNQQNFHFLLSYMYDVDLDHGGLIVVGVTSSSGKELLRYHTKGSQEDLRRRIWDKLESDGKLYLKVIRDVLSPHIEDGAPAVESRESVERTGNHDSSQGKSGDVVASDDVQEARRQYAQRSEEHDKRIREQQDARLFPKSVYDQPMSEMQLQTPIPSYEPEIRGGVDFPSLYARVLTISEVENLQRELRRCQNELLGREEYCRVCKRAFEFEGGEGQGIQAHYQEHLQEGIHRCPLCGDGAWSRWNIERQKEHLHEHGWRPDHASQRCPYPNCDLSLGLPSTFDTQEEVCKHLRVHFIKEIKAKKATKSSENGEEGPNTWGPTVVTFFQDAKAAEDYNFPSKRSHGGSPSAAGPRSQPPLPPINRPPTRDPEKKKVVKFAQDLSPGEKSYPTTPPMIQRDEIALKDDKSLSSSSSNDSGSSYQESTVQEPQSLADHQAVEHDLSLPWENAFAEASGPTPDFLEAAKGSFQLLSQTTPYQASSLELSSLMREKEQSRTGSMTDQNVPKQQEAEELGSPKKTKRKSGTKAAAPKEPASPRERTKTPKSSTPTKASSQIKTKKVTKSKQPTKAKATPAVRTQLHCPVCWKNVHRLSQVIKKTHGAKCGINVAQFTSVAPAIAATNREMVEGGQSPSATPPSAPTSTLEEETAKTGQPPRKGSVSKSPDAAKKTGTMNPPSLASKKGSVTNSATVGKTGQSPGIESTTTGVKRRASKDNFEGTAASPAKRRKSRAE